MPKPTVSVALADDKQAGFVGRYGKCSGIAQRCLDVSRGTPIPMPYDDRTLAL